MSHFKQSSPSASGFRPYRAYQDRDRERNQSSSFKDPKTIMNFPDFPSNKKKEVSPPFENTLKNYANIAKNETDDTSLEEKKQVAFQVPEGCLRIYKENNSFVFDYADNNLRPEVQKQKEMERVGKNHFQRTMENMFQRWDKYIETFIEAQGYDTFKKVFGKRSSMHYGYEEDEEAEQDIDVDEGYDLDV